METFPPLNNINNNIIRKIINMYMPQGACAFFYLFTEDIFLVPISKTSLYLYQKLINTMKSLLFLDIIYR